MRSRLIAWMVAVLAAAAWAPAGAQTYLYDAMGRLTEVRYGGGVRIKYALDLLGNATNTVVPAESAETDVDGDGLPDAWERVFFNTLTNAAAGDPNQNGKGNLWEYQNGRDPLDPDSDADGALNHHELRAGTDPLDPLSVFGFADIAGRASGPVIEWGSVTNKRYRVGRSTNLQDDGFTHLVKTNIPAAPPMNTVTDTTAVGAGPWFYRVELE